MQILIILLILLLIVIIPKIIVFIEKSRRIFSKDFKNFLKRYSFKNNGKLYKGYYKNLQFEFTQLWDNNPDYMHIRVYITKGIPSFNINIFGSSNIDIGDEYFNQNIKFIIRNKERTFGLLNSNNREIIRDFNDSFIKFMIMDNMIEIIVKKNQYKIFSKRINNILNLIRNLTSNSTNEKLLIQNIKNDPIENFRIKCMEIFINTKSNEDFTDFYKSLLEDKNLEIVLLAINQLGETGIQKAIDLYKYVDIDFSNRILTIFKKFSENNQIINSVIETLNLMDYKKSSLSIRFLNEINYNKFPDEIKSFLADEKLMENESELCRQIILFCGRLKVEEAVPFLIKELNSDNDEIVISVLESFRLFDKIEFVEHILPLTKGFNTSEVKQKALKTIDELQKKVSKDMKGNLSVADISSEEGNLSIVDDDGDSGKLSLE